MNNLDKYFKGQQKNEELVCFFRHHWISLLKEFFFLLISIPTWYLIITNLVVIKEFLIKNADIKAFFVIGFIIGTIFTHRFFLKFFNYFIDIGIITDMRIIDHKKNLFFRDTMEAIYMVNIQNIERKGEGIFPNVFRYGDLIIYLSASAAVKIFHRVPNAKFHFRCISRQKELKHRTLREARGLSSKDQSLIDTSNEIRNQELVKQ